MIGGLATVDLSLDWLFQGIMQKSIMTPGGSINDLNTRISAAVKMVHSEIYQ